MSTSDAELRLAPGDHVRITVWRKDELSGDFPISANGTIAHPLYREIQASGLTLAALEERLRTFLARYETNPQFVVFPLVQVIVAGEVRQPNILPVPPGTTVTQAIVLAGGPSERGRLDRVQLFREGRGLRLDLTRSDSDEGQIQLRSGDRIIVGRRNTAVRDYLPAVASSIAAVAATIGIFVSSRGADRGDPGQ